MSWEKKLKIFDEIVQLSTNSERKGKKKIYTSANGYMYAILNAAGEIGFQISKEDQKAFDAEFDTAPLLSYGAVMKDYVKIPERLFTEKTMLANWLDKAHNYVMTLKPK